MFTSTVAFLRNQLISTLRNELMAKSKENSALEKVLGAVNDEVRYLDPVES